MKINRLRIFFLKALPFSWNVLEFWWIKCFRFIIICITSAYVYNMTLEYFSWSLKLWVYLILLLGAFAKLWKVTFRFVMSVCPSVQNISAHTGQIFMKLYIWLFLKKYIKVVSLLSDKNNGYFTGRHMYVYDILLSSS